VVQDAAVKAEPSRDFEALYREHGDRIWRAVLAFSGDREVASDAVAEAFAQALRAGDRIRSPLAWIWRAAFRIAAGELGDRRTRGVLSIDVAARSESVEEDLVAALRRISPAQRAAVVLHHYAGYSAAEVAEIIGSSAAAVRVHLMRGRRRLRELLKEEEA
jgi:RNA polymerase sigma-70 factor (ECF subfamily)